MLIDRSIAYAVPRTEINIVFVSDFYDAPLSGLCMWNGKLANFKIENLMEDAPARYSIFPLGFFGRLRARIQKRLFEICVGHHWSYPDRENGAEYGDNNYPAWVAYILFTTYYGQWPMRIKAWFRRSPRSVS